ncbi:hypothetical protein EMPS_04108 [Entomortierella parvispora]|uniref:Uncharacterized protein n=1 Tax=Entomortierella parvispora TaxID=205924 RepID=A0A9P3H7W0_9FUNG|nr:hypothetical protein EMPS_04108 [Entomortierella parvispora]
MSMEEPTFQGSIDLSFLNELDIDDYFKKTHPSNWHPMDYITARCAESLAPFMAGLEEIGKLRPPPSAFARRWTSFMKSEAGRLLEEKSLGLVAIRRNTELQTVQLTKMQVGFASSTFDPTTLKTGILPSFRRIYLRHPKRPGAEELSQDKSKDIKGKGVSKRQRADQGDMREATVTSAEDADPMDYDTIIPETTAIRHSSPAVDSTVYRCSTPPPTMPELGSGIVLEGSMFWDMIGMSSTWRIGDVNISSSFDRSKSSILKACPVMNLCKDNIADFCHNGELQDFMDDSGFFAALDALPALPDMPQDYQDMLDNLFQGEISLEKLSERIDDLMKVPNPVPALNRYLFTSFQPLRTAFMNTKTIDPDMNERQYFRDYVVELLRGALFVHGLPYIWGEIYVPAVSYRKTNDADASGRGKFADGVTETGGHQILLSESSKLHRVQASKDQDDKMKLKRMLRDLLNYTILEMIKNKEQVKPSLKVFGTRTFKDTTELIAMDYHGMYRTYCLGSFKVVSSSNNVRNLKECWEMCLRFSLDVKAQVTERSEMGALADKEVIKLTKAARKLLTHTSFTPPKASGQAPHSPSKQRAHPRR